MRRYSRYALITMSIVLGFAATVFGQKSTGDIEGKVTDANGAVVPGVSITVTGLSVGFSRTIQSNSDGEFRIPQLPVGTYKVTTAAISSETLW